MATKTKTNSYDVARDLCVAPAFIIWLDAATGAVMSGPGEGVEGFGIVARAMTAEDGTPEKVKVSIHGAFVAKSAAGGRARWARWIVGPDGKCSLGDPAEGQVCLGSGTGRLEPHLAAVVYSKAGEYGVRIAAALAKKAKKAA